VGASPDGAEVLYAIESEKAIHKGTIISTFFAIVIAGGAYFLGAFGRIHTTADAVAANGFDSIIPSMLSNLSPILIGITVILVLSASMSTLSALVLASSSTLTLDFLRGNIIKKFSEKGQLLTMRSLVVVFIIISSVIAIQQYKSSVMFIAS
jgi:Na+/proline symporter